MSLDIVNPRMWTTVLMAWIQDPRPRVLIYSSFRVGSFFFLPIAPQLQWVFRVCYPLPSGLRLLFYQGIKAGGLFLQQQPLPLSRPLMKVLSALLLVTSLSWEHLMQDHRVEPMSQNELCFVYVPPTGFYTLMLAHTWLSAIQLNI